MKIYYRLSNQNAGGYKNKLPHITKKHCLENTIKVFGKENITVIGDNLNIETEKMVLELGVRLIKVNNGNGSGTFRDALNLAIEENSNKDIIYLLEDDFLHKDNAFKILEEAALQYDAYITGYDHPDKYIDKEYGGNPLIESGGEITRLIRTQNSHWKITNSTVMSFVTSRKRLIEDKDLLEKYSSKKITDSFNFFLSLSKEKGIPCLSSIPGVSTHTEIAWLSPLTNWSKI
jgi:glycosyltransferase involved in cell wall biosynthesis